MGTETVSRATLKTQIDMLGGMPPPTFKLKERASQCMNTSGWQEMRAQTAEDSEDEILHLSGGLWVRAVWRGGSGHGVTPSLLP